METIGEEIIQSCYIIREDFGSSYFDDELILLIKLLKALAPNISAAGLFYINRKLFPKFIAVIVSYIVIIFQFKRP